MIDYNLKKSQIIEAAKKHGLHITENSNAAHAAKNLFEANKRIIELEAIINTAPNTPLSVKLINNYNNKWNK